MITKDDVLAYIKKIPPTPAILKQTLTAINAGDLAKAAKIADEDLALKAYLKSLVNKPIYGFKNEVTDTSQIFGILGINGAQQVLYHYMLTLLTPDKWNLFDLSANSFQELQANLSHLWKKVLSHLNIDDKEIESAIALLPASIIVCDALFGSVIEEVQLLRSVKALDYNTILKRLNGMDLFDICHLIAKKWEMSPQIGEIVQAASGIKPSSDEQNNLLGQWMHLLLFFELSQPATATAGLNDFIDFQIEYVEAINDDFMQIMEIG